ncbi:stalk domain-containing protein [Anaerobacillus sp. MEB173]|uniref:stalk domain-containing protein n=1 Tax=Anaerobacillus sp. MEB173 TaxID=3383345 RepID=UPI003F91E3B9
MKKAIVLRSLGIGLLGFSLVFAQPLAADANRGGGDNPGQEKKNTSTEQRVNEQSERSVKNEQQKEDKEIAKEEQREIRDTYRQEKEQLNELKRESKEAYQAAKQQLKAEIQQHASTLELEGDLEGAFELESEAVKIDLKDRASYKRLGELYDKKNGNKGMKVFVNGTHPVFDVPPVIKSGRTLIPIRAVSEALNAEVDWNAEEQKVTIKRDGVTIELFLGENIAYIDGKEMILDVPAGLHNSRTVVPLRFISEALNSFVDWEPESGSVIIVDEVEIDEEDTTEDSNNDGENGDEV